MNRRRAAGRPVQRLAVTHRRRNGRARAPRVERIVVKEGAIAITWDGVTRSVPDRAVREAVRAAREHGGRRELGLSIAFVTDRALARLHARFFGDPSPTDVITFDLSDEIEGPAGEVCVSAECARKRSRARGVEFERELLLYVVHGVLHLCGFDDRTAADRTRMRAAELVVMRTLGYADDRSPHDA